MKLEAKLIDHLTKLHPDQRWLEFNGIRWIGTKSLFDKGMKVCGQCGYIMPIEREMCKCGERVFCDYSVVKDAPVLLPQKIEMIKPRKGKLAMKGILVV